MTRSIDEIDWTTASSDETMSRLTRLALEKRAKGPVLPFSVPLRLPELSPETKHHLGIGLLGAGLGAGAGLWRSSRRKNPRPFQDALTGALLGGLAGAGGSYGLSLLKEMGSGVNRSSGTSRIARERIDNRSKQLAEDTADWGYDDERITDGIAKGLNSKDPKVRDFARQRQDQYLANLARRRLPRGEGAYYPIPAIIGSHARDAGNTLVDAEPWGLGAAVAGSAGVAYGRKLLADRALLAHLHKPNAGILDANLEKLLTAARDEQKALHAARYKNVANRPTFKVKPAPGLTTSQQALQLARKDPVLKRYGYGVGGSNFGSNRVAGGLMNLLPLLFYYGPRHFGHLGGADYHSGAGYGRDLIESKRRLHETLGERP